MSDIHLRLRVGGEHYAMPIACVEQVAELGVLSTVPGTGGALLGVRNQHGQVLPVFDLARVLGIAADASSPRVVVAEHEGCAAGLAVDEVVDIAALGENLEQTDAELLSGAVLEDGHLIGIIDVTRLFDSLQREAV
ncbi:MAG TPA: chemotaxis protein CheW [Solirubrobacteraceae bacterium]|nr:chemotaxis protein CheW [Solirubrobacteraceae bacterium]